MEYVNANLTALQQRKYNIAWIIDTVLSAISIILILVYFDNLTIVISCFLVIIIGGICNTWVQLKYEQYKDIKMLLVFLAISVAIGTVFWLMYLV